MHLNSFFGSGSASSGPTDRKESLVEGNTAFAFDLYARLKGSPGNLFFSPFSISACLGLVCAGARGETERQIHQVLHFSNGHAQFHSSFGELLRQLEKIDSPPIVQFIPGQFGAIPSVLEVAGIQLNIANALWAQAGHPFLASFLKTARDGYLAKVGQAHFQVEADAARRDVNRWVAEKTSDKIQNIIPPGYANGLTRLVLANAIYFKGAWAAPFKDHVTSIKPFHLTATHQVEAPLMSQTDEFKYAENQSFQIIELPYIGGALSMVVVLPRRIDGCAQLENQLTPGWLARSLTQMQRRKVEVYLPRFKLESDFNLQKTLAKMGMPNAFGTEADLSGLDGERDLFVSSLFHKAWGKINEEGTEAVGATFACVAGCLELARPVPPPVFRADHPFIFFIRENHSGSLLFMGRLADPCH